MLYDGIKNLLLIPALHFIRGRRPARGVVFASFILGYGLLRFFIDFLREYPARLFGLPPGQWLNLCMVALGIALLLHCARAGVADGRRLELPASTRAPAASGILWAKRACYALLLASCLVIPSDWTQDVPARYGNRHPGLEHSRLYPPIPNR